MKQHTVRQWLLLTVLLALCAVSVLAVRPVFPAAHAASDTSCAWHIDAENDVTYPTLTGTRITGAYTYSISVSTLRNPVSGAYCGRAATGVCLWTHADNHLVDGLDLFLVDYVNGNLTGSTRSGLVKGRAKRSQERRDADTERSALEPLSASPAAS